MADALIRRFRGTTVWILVGYALLIGARALWPERSLVSIGPAALWDDFVAVAGTCFLLLAGVGSGRWILQRVAPRIDDLGLLEQTLFSLALGLGLASLGLFVLGCLGWFSPPSVIALVGIWLVAFHGHWRIWLKDSEDALRRLLPWWRACSLLGKAATVGVSFIGLASLLNTMTPAWSYDALMYHLPAPLRYLEAGRLLLLPDMWQANGPMAIELLYAYGLALGSASVARLVHLAFAIMLILATFAFTRRFLEARLAWPSAVVLVGIPIFPIWGTIANIDMAWALYEFLGVYAMLGWVRSRESGWVALSAISVGLALSSKYLGLGGAASVGVALITCMVLSRTVSWRDLGRFALLTIAFGCPWYLLNLIRAGNPVYPFIWGGPGWDQERLGYLMTYLRSFGGPNAWWLLPLAPIRMFTNGSLFTTFLSSIEFPSPLFLLALALPFTRPPRILRVLAWVTALRFVIWGLGSQQTRFLLPVFPALAVLSVFVLSRLLDLIGHPSAKRIVLPGLLGGLLLTSVVYQGVFWAMTQPAEVIVGVASKDAFLRRNVTIYPAQAFIQESLPPSARAFQMWDGAILYCDDRCIPDAEQSKWTQMVAQDASVEAVAKDLRARGIDYLVGNLDSLNFFLRHDPSGLHSQAAYFFLRQFQSECTRPVFENEKTVVERLTCS